MPAKPTTTNAAAAAPPAGHSAAQPSSQPSTTFRHATLSNGLTIIAEVDPSAHTAALGYFVKTGARDESSEVMGVSHFLEHMMFKGTARRTAEQVDLDFDRIGANHNAFTTHELTAFYAHVLPEHLPAAEEVLSDILRPALRQDDFDTEKNVILEEIAMYRDQPFWVLYEQTMERFYRANPLGHRVLGTPETIAALTQPQMAEYFQTRYAADNTVAAFAGRIDFDRMVDRLAEHCGSWNTSRSRRQYQPLSFRDDENNLQLPTVNRHYTLMVSPGPSIQDDRRYAAAILAQILGDSEGSRLYWSLVETGLAEEAQAQFEPRDGTGEMYVFLVSSPDDAGKVEQFARQEIARLVDDLKPDDLERVRNKVATLATLQGERPAGRMRRLGTLWTYTGEYRTLEDELARINAVTLEELREVYAAFPFRPMVTGRLRPGE
jgi:predicted Zn-dependent peptidase